MAPSQDDIARASNDDREWFEQNPTRSHRVRPSHPREFPGFHAKHARVFQMLVRQVQPGFRLRLPIHSDRPIPDVEATLHALFDTVMANGPGWVPSSAVATRVRLMNSGGRA